MPNGVELTVHIASDGDTPEYINQLKMIVGASGRGKCSVSNSEGNGYGANYNLAMQTVHTQLGVRWVLPLEDDWELIRPLDIGGILELLSHEGEIEPGLENEVADYSIIGCCRMGYIGYTQPLRTAFIKHNGNHYLLFDPLSAEPHVFAGHPRIETVEWERWLGPWPQGLHPGQTEWEVAHKANSREGVVWPIDLIKPYGDAFCHIGTDRSY